MKKDKLKEERNRRKYNIDKVEETLSEEERKIYESLGDSNISEKKAIELKELATTINDFSIENIKECFSGNKNIIKSTIKFTKKEMERYFNGYTSVEEMKEYIINLLNENKIE